MRLLITVAQSVAATQLKGINLEGNGVEGRLKPGPTTDSDY